MEINYNDTLQKRMLNWKYYGDNMNPFYSCVISYLIEIGGYKLSKDGSEYEQIKKIESILKTNPKIFKEVFKILTQNGFLEDLSFRYEYSNKFYKNRGDENHFSILKFKIIDGKLYVYDLITSRENRKYVEIKQINNIDVNELITLLKYDGSTDEEVEVLIQHKEVLQAYGIDSKSYNITLLNDNNLLNMQLDNPNIRLDFSIFFKEHSKSNLLDKSNFNLNIESSDTNISYGYDSNLKLLSLMHGLCKSEKDLSLFESIYKKNVELLGNGGNTDTNIDWMFMSSFFLLNQEEKNTLPDYLYLDLARKLKLVNPRGAICSFMDENNRETSYANDVNRTNYGCNDYIITDGNLDCKTLFHAIRNALAHSSYEVIDKNYIRIYGYNDENVMNCNFKIQKNMIIEFINKLSNYNAFGNIFPICTLENPNYDNAPIQTKKDLKSYLESIVVSDITDIKYHDLDTLKKLQMYASYLAQKENTDINENVDYKMLEMFEYDYERKIYYLKMKLQNPMTRKTKIIDSVIKSQLKYFMDYKSEEKKLSESQISKIIDHIGQIADTFYNHSAVNQHEIITELIRNELNPSRNISMIIEDIIKTSSKSDGAIMDMLNDTSTKYIDYDKVIKATVISYLNNILLYNYNEKKVDLSGLDFSGLKIDVDFDDLISKKNKRINDLKRENRNTYKSNKNMKKRLGDIIIQLERVNDENQKARLTEEKQRLETILSQDNGSRQEKNSIEMTALQEDLEDLKNRRVDNSCILEHLRNSLAHGNIFFSDTINLNDIGDLEITFIDYYPDTVDESFKGTIKFRELLTTLSDEKFIISLFSKINERTIDNQPKKN